jgi:predicted transcriptional regulator
MTVDLSELDQVCAMIKTLDVVTDRGFTVNDICRAKGVGRSTAERNVLELVNGGNIKVIGRRGGRGGAVVYELAAPAQ